MGEPPRGTAVATRPQQEAAATAVVTAAASTATSAPPALAPTASDREAVVDIPDDDGPPPGWGQWENWPTQPPSPRAGVLVMREDDYVMPRRPTHGTEASSSRAALPAPGAVVACSEQE
jgi:hypothetical protein